MKVELGKTYKDVITGFTGVCTGRVEYITGCNQALVAPKTKKDGARITASWIDEQRCELVKSKKTITLDNTKSTGFDSPAPVR